jgi:hypothetical protein
MSTFAANLRRGFELTWPFWLAFWAGVAVGYVAAVVR